MLSSIDSIGRTEDGLSPTPVRTDWFHGTRRPASVRVVHLMASDLARGGQTIARAVCTSLDDRADQEHRMATIFAGERLLLDADYELGCRSTPLRRAGLAPLAPARLRRFLRTVRADAVVAHGGEALKYAHLAGPDVPVVYHKFGVVGRRFDHPLRSALHRRAITSCRAVVAISDDAGDEARELLGVAPDRLVVIPNGRDPEVYRPPSDDRPAEPASLLFLGHLTRTKRPERFVEVVERLRSEGLDFTARMVGDGPLFDEVAPRAERVGIELLGRRGDVPELLTASDVLVFTSLPEGEGMPGVLIEAGLAGLAVVATDVPGARSAVADGVSGTVVAHDDLEALVAATRRVVVDADQRRAQGAAGRGHCVDHFSIDVVGRRWRDLVDDVLAG